MNISTCVKLHSCPAVHFCRICKGLFVYTGTVYIRKCVQSVCFGVLPGNGKKEKIRNGATQSSAKAWFTPMMSTRIRSEMCGVQKTTKQSCANTQMASKTLQSCFQILPLSSLVGEKKETPLDKASPAGHKS